MAFFKEIVLWRNLNFPQAVRIETVQISCQQLEHVILDVS